MRRDLKVRPVDLPMAADAKASLEASRIDSSMDYGIDGDPINFGVNEARNIGEADKFDRDGYDSSGLNIATGRTKATRYTGAR